MKIFRKFLKISLVSRPFNFNVNDTPPCIQLELINLQLILLITNQFVEKTITDFYASLNPEILKKFLDNAQKYLIFFGSK